MTRSLRRSAAALAVPAALLALTACGSSQAGAAAVVGDRRITISDVQVAYREIAPVVGQDSGFSQNDVLALLILEPYLTEAATELGAGVSVEDAKREIATALGKRIDQIPDLSEAGSDFVRAAISRQRLTQGGLQPAQLQQFLTETVADLRAAGVRINPRFGAGYDWQQLAIRPGSPDWLVTPEPTEPVVPGPGGPAPEGQVPPPEGQVEPAPGGEAPPAPEEQVEPAPEGELPPEGEAPPEGELPPEGSEDGAPTTP